MRVRFDQRFAVDVDRLAAQLQAVSGKADDALDEIPFRLLGVFEDDDVAAPNLTLRQQRPLEPVAAGEKIILLTIRWSPTSKFGSIEPVGILKA